MANMNSDRSAYLVTLTAKVGHECTLKSGYAARNNREFDIDEALRFVEHELNRWESKYGAPDSVTFTIRPTHAF